MFSVNNKSDNVFRKGMQLQNDGLERRIMTETPAKFRFINRPYRFLFIFLRYISVHVIRRGSEIKKNKQPRKKF